MTVFFLFCSSQRVDGTTWTTCWIALNTKQITCSVERVRRTMTLRFIVTRYMLHAIFRYGLAAEPPQRYATMRRFSFTTNLLRFVFLVFVGIVLCVNAVHSFSRHALVSVFGYYSDYRLQHNAGRFARIFPFLFRSLSLFEECTMFPVLFSIQSDFRFWGGKRRQANVPTRGRRVPSKKSEANEWNMHTKRTRRRATVCRNKMLSTFFFAIRTTRVQKAASLFSFGWA